MNTYAIATTGRPLTTPVWSSVGFAESSRRSSCCRRSSLSSRRRRNRFTSLRSWEPFIHRFLPFASIGTVEVSGRIDSGTMELIAAVLLLTPRFVWAGAVLAMAATGGAIVSHLTFLGIEVQGDKGLLFFLAIVVLVTSAITLYLHRMQIRTRQKVLTCSPLVEYRG